MATIELCAIGKRFGEVEVIRNIDLTMHDGKFTVLLGPSGCGKSTLLRMIAGLETPSSGEIRLDGKVVNDMPPVERGCAMVFQNYALYPNKTVRQNLAFPLRMACMDKVEQLVRIDETAHLLELTPLLERYPRQLSGGQRQRVAMGRAMIRRPKVFLYDEPLSNLDLELRVRLRLEIASLQRQLKSTTVYVTHDQTEAMTLADQIIVLRQGHIEQVGAPMVLYRAPANVFVAGFIGTPRMNLLAVREHRSTGESGTELVVDGSTLSLPQTLPRIVHTLGFRAENARLGAAGAHEVWLHLHQCETLAIEHLGDRSYAYLRCSMGELTVMLPADHGKLTGDVDLAIDTNALHFFDATEQAIR